MSEPGLEEKVVAITTAFARAHIPYAIGGAIALGYYGEPRVTIDIDVNIFSGSSLGEHVLEVLEQLGVEIDPGDRALIESHGQVRTRWGRNLVDLFFSSDSFHDEASKHVRTVPFDADQIVILGPEDLIIFKSAFDRPKDWIDIEQVLFLQAGELDIGYLLSWAERLFGREDHRYTKMTAAIESVMGTGSAG